MKKKKRAKLGLPEVESDEEKKGDSGNGSGKNDHFVDENVEEDEDGGSSGYSTSDHEGPPLRIFRNPDLAARAKSQKV